MTSRCGSPLLSADVRSSDDVIAFFRYISDPENLKIMMNMLRDPSKNIQFEAFHVFKVFVANPNKSKPIMDILLRNQSKLVGFLEKFHESRAEDEQFADEKSYLIKQIKELK